jgi:hypothetical protein
VVTEDLPPAAPWEITRSASVVDRQIVIPSATSTDPLGPRRGGEEVGVPAPAARREEADISCDEATVSGRRGKATHTKSVVYLRAIDSPSATIVLACLAGT